AVRMKLRAEAAIDDEPARCRATAESAQVVRLSFFEDGIADVQRLGGISTGVRQPGPSRWAGRRRPSLFPRNAALAASARRWMSAMRTLDHLADRADREASRPALRYADAAVSQMWQPAGSPERRTCGT